MAANSITASEARRLYKRQAPTHGRSKQHKEDLETISKASSPVAKAETLIAQRRTQSIDKRIEEMLQDHQGPRRNRYTYCGFRKFPDTYFSNSRTRVSVNPGQGFR